jgi:hypothetical protein
MNQEYPENKKGDEYGKMTYKPSVTVAILATITWLLIIAVIVFWAGYASAEDGRAGFNRVEQQTHDAQGRYILRGDPHARPSPHHSGGGITTYARRYFLRIADRGPFRIEGTWFSSGTMVLALVSGPDSVEGSCLGEVEMHFHEAIPLSGDNSNLNQNRVYSGVFTRELRNWYHTMRNGGGMSYFNVMTLDQNELGLMGYPVCEG